MVLVSKQTRLTNKRSVVSFTDRQASSCINNLLFCFGLCPNLTTRLHRSKEHPLVNGI